MRKAKLFGQKVIAWQLLADTISPELATKPHLQGLYDELVDAIQEAHSLQVEQETARAELMDTVRKRQVLELKGDGIRSRLSSFLRGELGPKNRQLVRYGVPPLSGPRRPEPNEPPPPVEEPAPEGPAIEVTG